MTITAFITFRERDRDRQTDRQRQRKFFRNMKQKILIIKRSKDSEAAEDMEVQHSVRRVLVNGASIIYV